MAYLANREPLDNLNILAFNISNIGIRIFVSGVVSRDRKDLFVVPGFDDVRLVATRELHHLIWCSTRVRVVDKGLRICSLAIFDLHSDRLGEAIAPQLSTQRNHRISGQAMLRMI